MNAQSAEGHSIGVGYIVLTLREIAGLSQRRLARAAGTSQGAISRAESGNHVPSLPSLFRFANTVGYRLIVGFAAPDVATLDPATVEIDDLALVGMLIRDPMDGLPCFRVLREPPPWAGPH
jgi:transcriptional regulator with XRE-family HTH domain